MTENWVHSIGRSHGVQMALYGVECSTVLLMCHSVNSAPVTLQAEKNAKSIVRELEDAKLAGIDYPVSSLINLRQVSPSHVHAL